MNIQYYIERLIYTSSFYNTIPFILNEFHSIYLFFYFAALENVFSIWRKFMLSSICQFLILKRPHSTAFFHRKKRIIFAIGFIKCMPNKKKLLNVGHYLKNQITTEFKRVSSSYMHIQYFSYIPVFIVFSGRRFNRLHKWDWILRKSIY